MWEGLVGEDELEELVADALATDALMGWDGAPCLCTDCDCLRFRDGTDPTRCPQCQVGDHWATDDAQG